MIMSIFLLLVYSNFWIIIAILKLYIKHLIFSNFWDIALISLDHNPNASKAIQGCPKPRASETMFPPGPSQTQNYVWKTYCISFFCPVIMEYRIFLSAIKWKINPPKIENNELLPPCLVLWKTNCIFLSRKKNLWNNVENQSTNQIIVVIKYAYRR